MSDKEKGSDSMKHSVTLQSKLTKKMVVSFILIISIIFTIVFSIISNTLYQYLKSELQLKADATTKNLEHTVSDLIKLIDGFVFDIENNTDCSETAIKKALDSKGTTFAPGTISAFYVGYGERNYLYETFGWIPGKDYEVKSRPWYVNTMNSDQVQMITYADANTGIFSICASKRIQTDNGEAATVAIDMEITSSLEAIKMSSDKEYFFVVDSNGMIIFHPNEKFMPHDAVEIPLSDAYSGYIKLDTLKDKEIISLRDYNGKNYYFTMNSIEIGGFRVFTGIQTSLATNNVLFLLFSGIFLIAILLTIVTRYLGRQISIISKPIVDVTEQIGKLSEGNFEIVTGNEDAGIIEIQQLQNYLSHLSINTRMLIQDIGQTLSEIADGHVSYQTSENYIGEYAQIKVFMEQISVQLTDLTHQVKSVSSQVGENSKQVLAGATNLSVGTAQQAETVKDLELILQKLSSDLKNYVNTALDASNQTKTSSSMVLNCNEKMKETMDAMEDVRQASDQIQNIVRSIEDIATQTNLLSLNAAIEAARAGDAGRGFAVVAEEVGNLAMESAEAAKNANVLIATTLDAIERGRRVANNAAESLLSTVSEIQNALVIVESIAVESKEHVDSIKIVTSSVGQITDTVGTNLSISQESTAASEELSEQAQLLNKIVARLHTD